MSNEIAEMDKEQPLEFTPDFAYEDRHEFVERRAFEHWEKRGRPLGSPDVDWVAAERAVYLSLVASGLVDPSADDLQHLEEKIYRPRGH
jgi:hypothetical protein